MKTLKDERYVVIKAYKFTISEIWRDFFVLAYIACTRIPTYRVYRLCDNIPRIGSALQFKYTTPKDRKWQGFWKEGHCAAIGGGIVPQ